MGKRLHSFLLQFPRSSQFAFFRLPFPTGYTIKQGLYYFLATKIREANDIGLDTKLDKLVNGQSLNFS